MLNIVLDSGNTLVSQKKDKAPDLRRFDSFIFKTIYCSKL
jgi:hypothetical protein